MNVSWILNCFPVFNGALYGFMGLDLIWIENVLESISGFLLTCDQNETSISVYSINNLWTYNSIVVFLVWFLSNNIVRVLIIEVLYLYFSIKPWDMTMFFIP